MALVADPAVVALVMLEVQMKPPSFVVRADPAGQKGATPLGTKQPCALPAVEIPVAACPALHWVVLASAEAVLALVALEIEFAQVTPESSLSRTDPAGQSGNDTDPPEATHESPASLLVKPVPAGQIGKATPDSDTQNSPASLFDRLVPDPQSGSVIDPAPPPDTVIVPRLALTVQEIPAPTQFRVFACP